MPPASIRRSVSRAVFLAVCLASMPATAQIIADPSASRPKDKNRSDEIVRTAPARPNPNAQNIWPRLDAGAVFCRTEDDLAMHSRVVAAKLDNTPLDPMPRPECVIINQATPIDIVERAGLGKTEVRIKEATPKTGWTDAFLPDKN